jgi:hypothetical protein
MEGPSKHPVMLENDCVRGASAMITPKLKWSWDAGEGDVKFPKEFRDMDWIVKADALQDWISILEKEYNATMEELFEIYRNRSKTV